VALCGISATQEMDEDEIKILDQFIAELNQNLEKNLPKIAAQFVNDYESSEFDPLRDEITKCLLCDFCQAAITLTNHLTENFLKTMLVYHESLENGEHNDLTTLFSKGLDIYDNMNLVDTIDKACEHEIINEEQKATLHKFRHDFRNAYSHASKRKIFKDSKIRTQKLSLNKELKYELEEPKESLASDLVFAQGLIQTLLSKQIAFDYFKTVDKIIRDALTEFYKNSDKTST